MEQKIKLNGKHSLFFRYDLTGVMLYEILFFLVCCGLGIELLIRRIKNIYHNFSNSN